MSEYIEIEPQSTADPHQMVFHTNLPLTDGSAEHYRGQSEMEEGSPLAQVLASIGDMIELSITGSDLIVRRNAEAEWHAIASDISAAVKDFFL